jgi:type IV pilus assembly protein PilB
MATVWEAMIEEGLINEQMLSKAREMQAANKSGLGFNLALQGADEESLAKFMASHYGVEYIDLLSVTVDPGVLEIISRAQAEALCIFPVKRDGKSVLFASNDPLNPEITSLIKELNFKAGIHADFGVAPESYIKLAIEQAMPKQESSSMADTLRDLGGGEDINLEVVKDQAPPEDAESVDEAPVIRMCNSIIHDAVEKKASDIHIEPFEKRWSYGTG